MSTIAPQSTADQSTDARRITLDNVIKMSTLLGLTLYILGLVVTNTYLYILGVSDFALVKPRYVYLGAWAIFTIIMVCAPIATLLLVVLRLAGKADSPRWARRTRLGSTELARAPTASFWGVVAAMVATSALLILIGTQAAAYMSLMTHQWLLLCGSAAITGGLLAWLLVLVVCGGADSLWVVRLGIAAVLAALSVALYVYLFALLVYPRIPAAYGGGGGKIVQLYFQKDAAPTSGASPGSPTAVSLGIELPMVNELATAPVHLLFEGNESYVLGFAESPDGPLYGLPTNQDRLPITGPISGGYNAGQAMAMVSRTTAPAGPVSSCRELLPGALPARVLQVDKKTVKALVVYPESGRWVLSASDGPRHVTAYPDRGPLDGLKCDVVAAATTVPRPAGNAMTVSMFVSRTAIPVTGDVDGRGEVDDDGKMHWELTARVPAGVPTDTEPAVVIWAADGRAIEPCGARTSASNEVTCKVAVASPREPFQGPSITVVFGRDLSSTGSVGGPGRLLAAGGSSPFIPVIPEVDTMWLFLFGLLCVAGWSCWRRR